MYGLGSNGGTPGGRFGGAFPRRGGGEHALVTHHSPLPPTHCQGGIGKEGRREEAPDVVATELRVVAVTVELLLRLKPRLLTLLRLEEAMTTGGATETVLEEVEKVLAEEWSPASLSTLVCWKRENPGGVRIGGRRPLTLSAQPDTCWSTAVQPAMGFGQAASGCDSRVCCSAPVTPT